MASVGPIDGMLVKCPIRPISVEPTSRPNTAVRIGRPIATSVVNVKSRMIIAATRPITSLDSVLWTPSVEPTGPPTSTFMPAARPSFTPTSNTLCAVAVLSVPLLTSSSTGMKA